MTATRRPKLTLLVISALLLLLALPSMAESGPDRSAPPELGPPPSFAIPQPSRFELSNGLPVVLLAKHDVPIVQIALLIRSGSVAAAPGVASMAMDLLDEGAGDLDALGLAEAVEYLGARLSTWSSDDASGVNLFTITARLDEALPLLADVVLRPAFTQAELDRLRTERLGELLQARDEARVIAGAELGQALFGARHPYGLWVGQSDLEALTLDRLKAFHRDHLRTGNASLVVVGDVTEETIRPRLEKVLGGMASGAAPASKALDFSQVSGRRIVLVDKPGAAQSEIRVARMGPDRKTSDFYALTVMNTVLGGSFTSRLNSNLREDKGYTYGARSGFSFGAQEGPFSVRTAVQTEVTAAALTEIFSELERIREIPPVELDRARNYSALRYPSSFQTVGGIASELAELVLYDLPADTVNHHVDRLLAVTGQEAAAAAEKWVDPDQMLVVVVGDRAVIEQSLRELKLGEMEILSIEDVLGPPPEMGEG